MRLQGKVAVITGAGSGIGRASAILFAAEGAKVIVADIVSTDGEETVAQIKRDGGEAIFVETDVSKAVDVERMVRAAVESYGRLDILFNNAGVDHPRARSVTETSEELWDYTMNVNVKGVFLCSKYAIPEMRKSGGGSIINTASIAGLRGMPAEAAYGAAKAGVVLLSKQMAIDYACEDIRVNSVSPGGMKEAVRDRRATLDEAACARREASLGERCPMGRAGSANEVAYAALFFASDESSFVTGADLVVDGGYTAK